MDNNKKTSLEEAKLDFQEIKKFATEAAKKEFEQEINKTVEKIIKESLSVEIDDDGNATVIKGDKVVELTNDGEIEIEDIEKHEEEMSTPDGEDYHDDDEEIEIEKNIEEMINFEEQAPVAPTANAPIEPVANAPVEPIETQPQMPQEPMVDVGEQEDFSGEDGSVETISKKLADNFVELVKTITGGEQPSEEQGVEVDYIDDENVDAPVSPGQPVQTPAQVPAQTPAEQPNPVQEEDELLEFSLDEIDECGINEETDDEQIIFDDDELEDINKDEYIDFDMHDRENIMDMDDEIMEIEINEEDELEEIKMMGQSHSTQRTTATSSGPENAIINRGRKNNIDDVPYQRLEESVKKIKAQYESKVDELKKENNRLNESNKEMTEVIKNYQESFKDLRKQFDEMQTFNAKLAYANKIFASGGLSTTDKAKIAEEFDKTKNIKEAEELYKKIIAENKISISKDASSKIKAPATNTVQSKNTIYESSEMKRRKVLAGIEKNEDYI